MTSRILGTLLLLSLLAPALFAQSTWNGGTSTNWGDAANWSSGVPTATTDATISGSAATMPTLNVAATCQSITIQTGATLTGGAQSLTVSTNWTNDGTFTAGTSTVTFSGSTNSLIGGTSTTSFYRVVMSKTLKTVTVTLNSPINITSTGTGTSCALDCQQGTFITNGQNMGVSGQTNSNGAANAELRVSVGGTVNFVDIYQWNLDNLTIQAGTVNISGTHPIVNSGHRCDISGGTVNYTNTSAQTIQLLSNNGSWGWFATAGDIFITGGVSPQVTNSCFLATGSAVVHFVGSNSVTMDLNSWGSNGTQNINFNDCRIEKTAGATVTMAATGNGTGILSSNINFASITVNAGAGFIINPSLFNPANRFVVSGATSVTNNGTMTVNSSLQVAGNIVNNGTLAGGSGEWVIPATTTLSGTGTHGLSGLTIRSTGTFNAPAVMSVSANFTRDTTGVFNHNNGAVTFNGYTTSSGMTISTITGSTTFFDFACTTPGKRIHFTAGTTQTVSNTINFTPSAAGNIILRSTSPGTKWFINDAGTETCSFCDVQDSTATNSIDSSTGGIDAGNNTNWILSSGLVVDVTVGTATSRLATDTGGGNGFQAGLMTIRNTSTTTAIDWTGITLAASGTGADQGSYTQVALYRDAPGTTAGSYDTSDTLIGTAATAFPTNDGSLAFTVQAAEQSIPASTTRTYFVVAKLNGATVAAVGQTFNTRVTAMTVASGLSGGYPTAVINGIVIGAPTVTFTDTSPASAVSVAPSASNVVLQEFTMAYPAGPSNTNQYMYIYKSTTSTGDPTTGLTNFRVYLDNGDGTFNVGTDTQANSGTITYGNPYFFITLTSVTGTFTGGQTKRFFFVANVTASPTNGQTFKFYVSQAGFSYSGTNMAGLPAPSTNGNSGIVIAAPIFTFADSSPASATTVNLSSTDNVLQNFTATYNSGAANNLNTITVTHTGTGTPSTGYSSVELYLDNGDGSFSAATDTLANTGTASFTGTTCQFTLTAAAAAYATSPLTKRFFVVVDISTSPSGGQTFKSYVSAATASLSGTGFQGLPAPSAAGNAGLIIQAPTLTVSATVGTVASVYANAQGSGNNGVQAGLFTITNNVTGTATLNSITITASGSGDDSTDYSEVAVYRDAATGTVGSFDFANDVLIGTAATAFPTNNGSLVFTVQAAEQSFAVSESRTYFVVVKLSGAASPTETFQYSVNDIAVSGGSSKSGVPSAVMAGLDILAPSFTITDNSSATQANAYLGGSNFVIQQFTVAYPNGPNNTLTSITVQSSGTGNDQTDYASVALYRDANANATYDVGVDVQVNSFTAFPANDGSQAFALSGTESQFTAGTTRQYFIVVGYNMTGTGGTTFATQLQAASGQSAGTTINGLPAPTAGPTAGLLLLANNLIVTVNGPSAATTVNNNDQGPGGLGHVILDFSLQTLNGAWTVTDLTFTGNGTANHQTAYNYLALFEDTNSSTTFDGTDTLATAAAGVTFGAGDNYTAALTNTAFPVTTTRRFFLVGKLAGTAIAGQTLNALISAATTTPPSGGAVTTLPTSASTALIIDTAVVTAFNGTAAPASATREGGTAFSHSLGFFSFTASNNSATLNAITLTTAGSGDWTSDVSAVEIYLDNGNGVYDAGVDTLVFTGAGATPTLVCTFTSAVNIANNQTQSLWVRLNFATTAGASIPETFSASIAAAGDVNVTGATALLGTPAPATNPVSVVIFFVTTFTPAFDVQLGGAAITIVGSGFLSPLTVTIGGAVCAGTPVISGGGTQITGLTVPPGTGQNLAIVINNGAMGPKTLTQTFDYAGGGTVGGGGGGGGGDGGCSTEEGNAAWLAALALLCFAGILIRMRLAR